MKNNALLTMLLALIFPICSWASDATDVEKDLSDMQVVIKDFCEVKDLCENKEKGQFSVYHYNGEETDKQLLDSERQVVKECRNKFEIRMTINSVDTLHIYCFEQNIPMLLLSKQVPRNDN